MIFKNGFVSNISTNDLLLELSSRLSERDNTFELKILLKKALGSLPDYGVLEKKDLLRALGYVIKAYTKKVKGTGVMEIGNNDISTDDIISILYQRLNIKDFKDAANYSSWVPIAEQLVSKLSLGEEISLFTSGCLELVIFRVINHQV